MADQIYQVGYTFNGQPKTVDIRADTPENAVRYSGYGSLGAKVLNAPVPTQTYNISYTTRDGKTNTTAIDAADETTALSKIGEFGGTNGRVATPEEVSGQATAPQDFSAVATTPPTLPTKPDGTLNIAPGTDPSITDAAVAKTLSEKPARDAALASQRAAYDAKNPPPKTPDNYSKGNSISQQDYYVKPGETGAQYTARIAKLRGENTPTQPPAVDTNYQMRPGETSDQYTSRIRDYNATNDEPGNTPGTAPVPTTSTSSTPATDFVQKYLDALDTLGVNDLKKEADIYSKQYTDLTNEMNDKIADANENPWLDEGTRAKEVTRIKSRYETRLDTLTGQQKLYESLYEQGVADAKYLTTGEVQQQQDMITAAQKQADAMAKTNTQVVEVDGKKVLIDQDTGDTIRVLGGAASGSGSGSASNRFTKTQSNTGAANAGISLGDFQSLGAEDQNYFINGYGTFKSLLSNFQQGKITPKEMRSNIESSNLSAAIKSVLLSKAGLSPSVAGTSTTSSKTPIDASTDYKTFVNENVLPVLGSGWNLIAGLIGL